jgi:hypothetical protein
MLPKPMRKDAAAWRRCGALVAVIFVAGTVDAEPETASASPATMQTSDASLGAIVRANLEPSYLAYPLGFYGLEPLYFETSIVPNFSVLPRSWHVALFLTPKIVLRMFRAESAPVRTPSYMPRLSAYLWFDEAPQNAALYFSATIGHHSNGQAGGFSNADGTRNHDTGSFETNFMELAAYPIWQKGPLFAWNSIAVEYHPPFLQDTNLHRSYGDARIHLATTLLTTSRPLWSQLSARVTIIVDEMAKPTNAGTALARFPILLQYTVRPPAIDVGVYAAYYQGQDYYNIWYDRFISTLEFGFSGNLSTGIDVDIEHASSRVSPTR